MKAIVNNWIRQAEADISSAKYNYDGKKFDVAAYLCHQSVEKAFKALYLKNNNKVWKIHDLVKLGNIVDAPNKIIKLSNDLNPIYAEDRYPDYSDTIPAEKFSANDIVEFLNKTEVIIKWIKEQLQ